MLNRDQIESELNLRNYWDESQLAPPATTLPATIPPATTPPSNAADIINKYGSLIIVSIGLLFLIAIFPGQGGAE